jgi:hypothetical protein
MRPIEIGALVKFISNRAAHDVGLYSLEVIGIVMTMPTITKWSDLHKLCTVLTPYGVTRLISTNLTRID